MRKIALALSVVIAAAVFVLAAADMAEGRRGRGGFFISSGGFSVASGRHGFNGPRHFDFRPHRSHFGDTSFFFGLSARSGYGRHAWGPYRGRYSGYYPSYRYRGYDREYRLRPYRGRRVWIPGRMIDGRYRSGYWEHREFRGERHERRHDRNDERRGRGRGPY